MRRKTIKKNWTSRTIRALGMASMTLITGAALAGEYNMDKIGDFAQQAHRDLTLTCARRSLHDALLGTKNRNPGTRGVPKTSRAAINAMASNNIECSDVDFARQPFRLRYPVARFRPGTHHRFRLDQPSKELRPVHCRRLQSGPIGLHLLTEKSETASRLVQRHDQFAGSRGLCVGSSPDRLGS